MSKSSTDILSIDNSSNCSYCDAIRNNNDGENKCCCSKNSFKNNYSPSRNTSKLQTSPSASRDDRSDHYVRLLKETQQSVSNRDVLISMLQRQLKKMEDLYKKSLDDQQDVRLKYSSTVQELSSLKIIYKKSEEENEKLRNENQTAVQQNVHERDELRKEAEKWRTDYDELSKTINSMEKSASAIKVILQENNDAVDGDKNNTIDLLFEHCKNMENILMLQDQKLNTFMENINLGKYTCKSMNVDNTLDLAPIVRSVETGTSYENLKSSLSEANKEIERLNEMLNSKTTTDISCNTSFVSTKSQEITANGNFKEEAANTDELITSKTQTKECCCNTEENDETKNLEYELDEQKLLVEKKEEDIQQLEDKLETMMEKFEMEKMKLAKKNEDLETQINQLNEEHSVTVNDLENMKRSKDSLYGKVSLLNQTLQQYKNQERLSKTEIVQSSMHIEELQATVDRLEEKMAESAREHECQIEKNKFALSEVSAKYANLLKEFDEISDAQQDVSMLKTENTNLIHEIEDRDVVIETLRVKICDLEGALEEVHQQMVSYNKKSSKDIEELQNTCGSLECRLVKAQNVLQEEEKKSLEETNDTMEIQIEMEELLESNKALSEELAQKSEQIDYLNAELRKIQMHYEEELKRNDDSAMNLQNGQEIEKLEGEINQLQNENQQLQEQINELMDENNLRKERENASKISQFETESVMSKNRELQNQLDGLLAITEENKSLSNEIAQLNNEVAKLKQSQKEMGNLILQNDALSNEVDRLKVELSSHKKSLEDGQQNLLDVKKIDVTPRAMLSTIDETDESPKCAEKCSRIPKAKTCCGHANKDWKVNAHLTVLYNNKKYKSSTDSGSVGSTDSGSSRNSAVSNKFERLQKRLTSINQMEKQVEDMISSVQQQNKKLQSCNSARLQNEKEIEQRLIRVKQKRETLTADFNAFQNDLKGLNNKHSSRSKPNHHACPHRRHHR